MNADTQQHVARFFVAGKILLQLYGRFQALQCIAKSHHRRIADGLDDCAVKGAHNLVGFLKMPPHRSECFAVAPAQVKTRGTDNIGEKNILPTQLDL